MLSWTFALLSLASGSVHLFLGGPGQPARREAPVEVSGRASPDIPAAETPLSDPPAFLAEARAVSNWRNEAVQALYPSPLSALAVALRVERPVVTRCVKLNNYWCIKRARWNGEIGFDEEGHVGFASAERGADAAVRLLRRYYLEFGRKSALDIVRRWAPAECRVAGGGSAPPAVLAIRGLGNTLRARWLAARRARPAPIRVASAGNAFPASAKLAGEASAGAAAVKPAPPVSANAAAPKVDAPKRSVAPARSAAVPQKAPGSRVSAIPLRPLPTLKMPSIMAGLGDSKPVTISATLAARAVPRRQPTPASVAAATQAAARRAAAPATPARAPAPKPTRVASQVPATGAVSQAPAPPLRAEPSVSAAVASPPAPPAPRPVVACAPDEQRIQNYAGRIVQGLDVQAAEDLKLFEPDGRPLPNLTRVLLAMSSFELGYLRASVGLVEGAVLRATPPAPPRPEQTDGGPGSLVPVL